MQYCIQKCIVINVTAYYNKVIKIQHTLIQKQRRELYGNRNGSFKIYRWNNPINSGTSKSIYVISIFSNSL